MSAATLPADRGGQTQALLDALCFEREERISVSWRNGRRDFTPRLVAVADAPALVAEHADGDCWIGANPVSAAASGRGTARDVVALRSLHADLDVKPGGMPSWEAAEAVIDDLSGMLGARPTVVVMSGHGLQPRWMVGHDPERFDNAAARSLHRRWGELVASVARRRGGEVDNAFDISRVLRAPGTVNRKAEPVETRAEFTDTRPLSWREVAEAIEAYREHPMTIQDSPDELHDPTDGRDNPHEGAIPVGQRNDRLWSYACMVVGKYPGATVGEVTALVLDRRQACEQLATAPTEEEARSMAERAYREHHVDGIDPATGAEVDPLEAKVSERVEWLRVQDKARRRYAAEVAAEHAADFESLFLTAAELAALQVPPALIAGVLPVGANVVLRGRDHSFKTFVALDMALHVATGWEWNGHAVQQGRALYIAGEGAYGLGKRLRAWEEGHGVTVPEDAFTIRTAALDLRNPGPAFDHLLATIGEGGYRLVVIDTLRRVSGGADENSSEMGAVVDNIDRIKRAAVTGSTLTLAHTGKDDKDTRGWSGSEDDIDVVWHAVRLGSDKVCKLANTKMKDGDEHPDITMLGQVAPAACSLYFVSGEASTGDATLAVWGVIAASVDGMTQAEIVSATKVSKGTVSKVLSKLEKQGSVIHVLSESSTTKHPDGSVTETRKGRKRYLPHPDHR